MAALWFRLASSKKTGMAQLRVVLAGTAAYDEPCAEAEVSSGQQRVCGLYAIEQQYFLAETAGAVDGELVLAVPSDGCSPFVNAQQTQGKIVIIDRGSCTFATKTANAQSAGAAAVIVANNQAGEAFSMSGNLSSISIPAVMVTQSDAIGLKASLGLPAVIKTGACSCSSTCEPCAAAA
jgi:hypothetical protein